MPVIRRKYRTYATPGICHSILMTVWYAGRNEMRKAINVLTFLKPTGHVMQHRFNVQQLYALPTLYLCVLYLSENKQRLVPLTA
jgi:hypothetical protein